MKILITGVAGFIGSHIAEAYISEGFKVFGIDNLSTGFEENIPREVEFMNMDIRSPSLKNCIKKIGPDVINHNAASVSIKKSIKEPIGNAKINISGTLNLLHGCSFGDLKYKVKRIIFASTHVVYGIQDSFPISENHMPLPISPYGVSKLSCEYYLNAFKRISRFNYISMRYAAVYGPRQTIHGEAGNICSMVTNATSGKKKFTTLNENVSNDYIYIDDIVMANILAIKHGGGIINIGTGIETNNEE